MRAEDSISAEVLKAPFRKTGGAGWLLTVGVILAWDFAGPETMSEAFRRVSKTPGGLPALAVTWSYLTIHLFEVLPRRWDPFDIVHQAWVRRRHVLAA